MIEQQKQFRLKKERMSKYGLLLAIVLLFFVSSSFSQERLVKLEGWVTDQVGNIARNATLLAINRITNFTAKTVTDENGRYIFRNMPPGRYRLELSSAAGSNQVVYVELLPGYDYMLNFPYFEKGELLSFVHDAQIKFVVTDGKGKPIPNACIKFTKGSLKRVEDQNAKLVLWDEKNECFPNTASGESVIFLFDPRYQPISFEIKVPGYKNQKGNAELNPDGSLTLTFRLKKKGIFGFFQ